MTDQDLQELLKNFEIMLIDLDYEGIVNQAREYSEIEVREYAEVKGKEYVPPSARVRIAALCNLIEVAVSSTYDIEKKLINSGMGDLRFVSDIPPENPEINSINYPEWSLVEKEDLDERRSSVISLLENIKLLLQEAGVEPVYSTDVRANHEPKIAVQESSIRNEVRNNL